MAGATGVISNFTAIGCRRSAVRIRGDGHKVQIDGMTVIDTPVAIDVDGASEVSARRVVHEESPEPKRPRKYFEGFSFSKGDHLPKE